jgi:hypothetical protein
MAYLMLHAHVDRATTLSGSSPRLDDYFIAGGFLDCMPSNLLDTDGEMVPIDVEWDSDLDIPLGWVVSRGLIWSLMSGLPRASHFDLIDVVAAICQGYNLSVGAADLQRWMELEAAFQTAVTGKPWRAEDLRHTSGGMQSFSDAVDEMNAQLAAKEQGQDNVSELRSAVAEKEMRIEELNARVASREVELARAIEAQELLRREVEAIKSERSRRLASRLSPDSWREQRQLKQDEQLASESGLFDRDWYLSHNPDVAASGHDPLIHYLKHGGQEGRDPGPDFDSEWYLNQNGAVRARGMNPLIHFLRFGKKEGRSPKSSEGKGDKP